jgi:hypothetical protein
MDKFHRHCEFFDHHSKKTYSVESVTEETKVFELQTLK